MSFAQGENGGLVFKRNNKANFFSLCNYCPISINYRAVTCCSLFWQASDSTWITQIFSCLDSHNWSRLYNTARIAQRLSHFYSSAAVKWVSVVLKWQIRTSELCVLSLGRLGTHQYNCFIWAWTHIDVLFMLFDANKDFMFKMPWHYF